MLHIDIPTLPEFKALAAVKSDACVSLYLPTSPLPEHFRSTVSRSRIWRRKHSCS